MRKCAEVLMKIWRNLEESFRKLCRNSDSRKSRIIFLFCNDVLEMTQKCPQQEISPEILFIVSPNTIIAGKTQTHLESAPGDTISSECIKQQSINFNEQL